jgi:hypothetical protein
MVGVPRLTRWLFFQRASRERMTTSIRRASLDEGPTRSMKALQFGLLRLPQALTPHPALRRCPFLPSDAHRSRHMQFVSWSLTIPTACMNA